MTIRAVPVLPPPHVHSVRRAEIDAAATSLATAFKDDPLIGYLFQDPFKRDGLSRSVFRLFLRQSMRRGTACAASPGFESVATWVAPDQPDMGIVEMIRCGALPLAFLGGPAVVRRLLNFADFAGRLHFEYAPGPHWYLTSLGTAAEHRKRGLGRLLIDWVTDMADEEELPCYLETNNESNVSYYGRFGFEVMEQTVLPGSDVRHWAMLRSPTAAEPAQRD